MKKVLLTLAATAAVAVAVPAAAQPYGNAYGRGADYGRDWHRQYNSDLSPASLNARQAKIAAKIDSYARNGLIRPAEANRFMNQLRRIDVREDRLHVRGYSMDERREVLRRLTVLNDQIEHLRNSRQFSYGYGHRGW